ncbi:Sensor histidine kinase AtoS [Chitinispirillum alkaliphilum]|nr:Sensor histidine kinase AtoS [Chitinispirillum alkaliphilum]
MDFSVQGVNTPQSGTPGRILVIDSSTQMRSKVKKILHEAGYQTLEAQSGSEALKLIGEVALDAVILDVVMPDINGIEVARKIKAITKDCEFLPVLLLSGLVDESHKLSGLKYADDYVAKPCSCAELIARVESLLRIRFLQRDLLRSRENYRSLYEHFPHLILTLDTQLNIVDCNQIFCSSLEITKEQVIGKPIVGFIDIRDHSRLLHYLSLVKHHQTPVKNQMFEMSASGGDKLYVDVKGTVIATEESAQMILLTMVNITEKIRFEEEKKIARKQLYRSAKLAAIGTLASGVAHEVNNPLTAIMGFSSSILDRIQQNETLDPKELQHYLQIIIGETMRCRDIIDNLSRFARRDECTIKEFSLHECIDNALKLIHSRAVKKGISFEVKVAQVVRVKADPNKLEQVFFNVFTNCLDFAISESVVKISLSGGSGNPDMVKLKISDQGPGIEAEVLSSVFDPFFTTKDSGPVAGMGLAVCYRMMEDFGGKIEIYNDLEAGGTTVSLEIPKA